MGQFGFHHCYFRGMSFDRQDRAQPVEFSKEGRDLRGPFQIVEFFAIQRNDVVIMNTKGLTDVGDESVQIVEEGALGSEGTGDPVESGARESASDIGAFLLIGFKRG